MGCAAVLVRDGRSRLLGKARGLTGIMGVSFSPELRRSVDAARRAEPSFRRRRCPVARLLGLVRHSSPLSGRSASEWSARWWDGSGGVKRAMRDLWSTRLLSGQLVESNAECRPHLGDGTCGPQATGSHPAVPAHWRHSTFATPNSRIQNGWGLIHRERHGHDLDS